MGDNAAWRAWAAPASKSAAPPRSHDRRVSPHEGQCRKASVGSAGIAGPPCRRSATPDRAAGPAGVSASAGQAAAPTSTSGPSPRNRCSCCCPPAIAWRSANRSARTSLSTSRSSASRATMATRNNNRVGRCCGCGRGGTGDSGAGKRFVDSPNDRDISDSRAVFGGLS